MWNRLNWNRMFVREGEQGSIFTILCETFLRISCHNKKVNWVTAPDPICMTHESPFWGWAHLWIVYTANDAIEFPPPLSLMVISTWPQPGKRRGCPDWKRETQQRTTAHWGQSCSTNGISTGHQVMYILYCKPSIFLALFYSLLELCHNSWYPCSSKTLLCVPWWSTP